MSNEGLQNPLAKLFTLEFIFGWTSIVAVTVGIYFALDAKADQAIKKAGESEDLSKVVHQTQQVIKTEIATMKIQVQNANEKIDSSDERINKRLDTLELKLDKLLQRSN